MSGLASQAQDSQSWLAGGCAGENATIYDHLLTHITLYQYWSV